MPRAPLPKSEQMSRVRSQHTTPERQLRSALWAEGYRFRVHLRVEGLRPDIVFINPRLVVFVDGCFWHGCPTHYRSPRTRSDFWMSKLRANVERDQRQTALLMSAGWRCIRVWEHEVEDDLAGVARRVGAAIGDPHAPASSMPDDWRVIAAGPNGHILVRLVPDAT